MEPRADIERRQLAAHRWLEVYAGKTRNGPPGHSTAAERALAVIVLTHKTGDYLAEHDPQALKQAQEALDGTSWMDYSGQDPSESGLP